MTADRERSPLLLTMYHSGRSVCNDMYPYMGIFAAAKTKTRKKYKTTASISFHSHLLLLLLY